MSSFHFCLSAAKNLSSFQLLPASLMTDLLQLFLGLPLFLHPWGFHSRAAFDISPSSFLNVWPIHLNFLCLIADHNAPPYVVISTALVPHPLLCPNIFLGNIISVCVCVCVCVLSVKCYFTVWQIQLSCLSGLYQYYCMFQWWDIQDQ